MLTRLIYSSHGLQSLERGDIDQILDAARRHNLEDGVTGMLCHGNNRFLQYLEGEEVHVARIYGRIEQDPRHGDLKIIDQRALERRFFGDWSMGFVDIADLWTRFALREVTRQDQFLPEDMDSATALRLMNSLKAGLADQVIVGH